MMQSSFLHHLQNPHIVSSIEEQWKLQSATARAPKETVFALQFVDNDTGLLLVGCTSRGRILVWNVPWHLQMTGGTEEEEEVSTNPEGPAHNADPISIFRLADASNQATVAASSKCLNLYAMEYVKTTQGKHLLVIAGDGGVYVLDWMQQIRPLLPSKESSPTERSMTHTLQPRQTFRPHPNPWEHQQNSTECNDICFSSDHQHMFSAAGDAFGCYKWDLSTSQLVATYQPRNNKGCYLHTVNIDGSNNTVLIGGEASTLELWDANADQRIEALLQPMNSSNMSFVTCSASIGDWWMVGGGKSGSTNNCSGMVATYHRPTRSLVHAPPSATSGLGVVQHIVHDASSSTILSVGQEPWISYWSSSFPSLTERVQVRCESSRSFALATTTSTSPYMAVGGTSDTVDVLYAQTVPYCQLRVPPDHGLD